MHGSVSALLIAWSTPVSIRHAFSICNPLPTSYIRHVVVGAGRPVGLSDSVENTLVSPTEVNTVTIEITPVEGRVIGTP